MHAALRVEADLLHVPSGLSEQDPALISEPDCGSVEIRVLGVVLEAVIDDEVEVGLELLEVVVALGIDALPHGGEIHRVLDVVQVVRHLRTEADFRNAPVGSVGSDLEHLRHARTS